jgi:hypothetical protein
MYLFNKNELPFANAQLAWKDQNDLIERYKGITAFKQ